MIAFCIAVEESVEATNTGGPIWCVYEDGTSGPYSYKDGTDVGVKQESWSDASWGKTGAQAFHQVYTGGDIKEEGAYVELNEDGYIQITVEAPSGKIPYIKKSGTYTYERIVSPITEDDDIYLNKGYKNDLIDGKYYAVLYRDKTYNCISTDYSYKVTSSGCKNVATFTIKNTSIWLWFSTKDGGYTGQASPSGVSGNMDPSLQKSLNGTDASMQYRLVVNGQKDDVGWQECQAGQTPVENAGIYEVRYKARNGNVASLAVKAYVGPQKPTADANAPADLVYSGSEMRLDQNFRDYDYAQCVTTDSVGTNAGTYKASVALGGDYPVWSDGTNRAVDLEWKIGPKDIDISDVTLTYPDPISQGDGSNDGSCRYDGDAKDLPTAEWKSPTTNPVLPTVVYVKDGEQMTDPPRDRGIYDVYVQLEGGEGSNFNGTTGLGVRVGTLTIGMMNPTVGDFETSWSWDDGIVDCSWTADGKRRGVKDGSLKWSDPGTTNEITIQYLKTKDAEGNAVEGSPSQVKPKDAGTYEVYVFVGDGNSFVKVDSMNEDLRLGTLTVGKARGGSFDPSLPIPIFPSITDSDVSGAVTDSDVPGAVAAAAVVEGKGLWLQDNGRSLLLIAVIAAIIAELAVLCISRKR